jgi:hypothetical protein
MDLQKQNQQYYDSAIAWAEKYLSEATEPLQFNYKQGEIIDNDIQFIETNLARLKEDSIIIKRSAYYHIREFKQFYEKIKEKGLLDKLI